MSKNRGNSQRIQHRRGSAAEWTVNNPILFAGELGYETDTTRIKVGDGVTQWVNLAYVGQFGANDLDGLTDVSITSPASGAVLRYDGASWTDYVLSKSDVGLSNVDNTSDANKPVSTAQAAADAAVASAASSDATSKANAAQAAAIQRANHTGTQPASTITGLAAVATSGSYNDLSNKPNVISQADADARYVNITGDTMTGALTATAVTASSSGLYSVDGTTNCRIIAAAGISYFGATSNNSVHLQANNQSHVVILPSGNVGIGTTSPGAKLHVAGSGQGIFIEDTGANRAVLGLYAFNNELRIQGTAYVNAAQPLTVWTANAERMRIDANGNVGIGTTSPSARLDVRTNTANDGILLASSTSNLQIRALNGQGANNGIVQANDSGIIYTGGTVNTGAFVIAPWNNATCGLRMDANGNVGIGTASPTTRLDVAAVSTIASGTWAGGTDFVRLLAASGSAFSEQAIAFQEAGTNVGAKIGVKNQGNGAYDIVFANRDNSSLTSAFAERARIAATGNVGIGTTSPNQRLHVSGGQFWNTTSDFVLGSTGTIIGTGHGAATGNTYGFIAATNVGGTAWSNLVLQSGGGNVGIGTASPDQRLAVSGNISCSGILYASTGIQTSGARALFRANGEQYGVGVAASAAGGFVYFGANNGTATPDAVISAAGGNTLMTLQNGGNVGIGTTSPTRTLHVNSAGFFAARIQSSDTIACVLEISAPGRTWELAVNGTTGTTGVAGTFYIWQQGAGGGPRFAIDPTGNVGIGTASPTISSGVGLHLSGSTLRLGTARTPASSTATGNQGEVCWDSSYLYVCIATNTWRRIALTTW
jgi:hypothetical protein